MTIATETMSKGDFAAFIGITAGRVSQYIAQGKISADALDGEGRKARIRTAVAIEQLKRNLDPSQRFGANGFALRSATSAVEPPTVQIEELPLPISAETAKPRLPAPTLTPQMDELAELRIRQERVKAERAEREQMLDVGRYMLTDDVRREMAKAVASAYAVMEQGLQDMAAAMAEQFGIPQRDAQHALAKSFRTVRANAAVAFSAQADDVAEHVEDQPE